MIFFNTLQRRIFREVTRNFLFCATFLLIIVMIGRAVQMRDYFSRLNINGLEFVSLLVYISPLFMLIVIPLACMLSIFLTFLRMSTDRELVALKAGGVSVTQMVPAPLLFACICFFLTLLLSLYGISWGVDSFRSTVLHFARTKAQLNLQPGVFNQDIAGMTLFARQVDPESGEMRQVIFEDTSRDENSRITIIAPVGSIVTDEAVGDLVFNLYNGKMYKLDKGNVSILNFREHTIRLSLAALFADDVLSELSPKEMSWEKLKQDMLSPPEGSNARYLSKVAIELQKRWSLPTACIVLALFAVPLACSFEGAKKQYGIVLALVAFLLYYSLYSAGISLSESGRLNHVVSIWFPNALFFVLGIVGLFITSREGAPSFTSIISTLLLRRKKNRTDLDSARLGTGPGGTS